MGHTYQAVGWNRQKKIYDRTLLLGVVAYLAIFVGTTATLNSEATIETLLIRAFGTAAILLLHVILSIGPLCRMNPRFLPLLYNRRHMGVTMFVLAFAHGGFATFQFHLLGDLNPFVSILTSNSSYGSLADFPFQPLGLAALVILFLMAATSHDFWLANLSAPVWKSLHMLVYVAYALLVMHVALGALQSNGSPVLVALIGLGLVWIVGIHLKAGFAEKAADEQAGENTDEGFVDVCGVDDIQDDRARIVCVTDERVAVFKYDGKVSAVSNACQHQNGPLGEGRVIDGCIMCPWHGYQYAPRNGASPPPFTEKVPTFNVRVKEGRVLLDPTPNPAGTEVEPARIDS